MRNYRLAVVVIGLVLTLGGAPSWGQDPSSNDTSDGNNNNTGGGSGALVNNTTGTFNTGYGQVALSANTTGILNTGNVSLITGTVVSTPRPCWMTDTSEIP